MRRVGERQRRDYRPEDQKGFRLGVGEEGCSRLTVTRAGPDAGYGGRDGREELIRGAWKRGSDSTLRDTVVWGKRGGRTGTERELRKPRRRRICE